MAMRVDAGGRRGHPTRAAPRGFALPLVVWSTGLLALLALPFVASVRVHVGATRNAVARAEAAALADAGIALGIVRISGSASDVALPPGFTCTPPGGGRITVAIADEAGRVDLNLARDDVLRALLTGVGLDADGAARLRDAIVDWRDPDDTPEPRGAEASAYRDAGRPAGPRNAPFETVEDLGAVPGVDAPMLARLRPFLTVRSGQEGVAPSAATPDLVAVLARGATGSSAGGSATSRPVGTDRLPDGFAVASTRTALSVRVTAVGPRGGRATREAIVERTSGVRPRSRVPARRRPREPDRPGVRIWEYRTVADGDGTGDGPAPPCEG
jgi:general secretion pathway protein K